MFHVYSTQRRQEKFEFKCPGCSFTLSHGKFMVMTEDGKWMLKQSDMKGCLICGKKIDVPLYFYSEIKARRAQEYINTILTIYYDEKTAPEEKEKVLKKIKRLTMRVDN